MTRDPHGQWWRQLEDARFRLEIIAAESDEEGDAFHDSEVRPLREKICVTQAKTLEGAYHQLRYVLDITRHNAMNEHDRRALELAALTIFQCTQRQYLA
ncbi:MAG: hypothetical protein KDH19_10490 [Geminicoccaceae bacterium]|nr:hypothetical protein [Geminicoccaceae bacterium]